MSKTPIYIPTYARDKVITVEHLSPELRKRVILVVKDDASACKIEENGWKRWIICPEQGHGAYRVRNWLIERARKRRECCIMLDDDLSFRYAVGRGSTRKFEAIGRVLDSVFEECEALANNSEVGLVGFSHEYFNRSSCTWQKNKDNAAVFFVNAKQVCKRQISFDLPSIGDRSFQMQCIEQKLTLWSNMDVAVKQHGKTGGEFAIPSRALRTAETTQKLIDRYPRFVKYRKNGKASFLLANMAKAVAKGENVRLP